MAPGGRFALLPGGRVGPFAPGGRFGVRPGRPEGIIGVFAAPLLHGGLSHLGSNSVPLFVLLAGAEWLANPTFLPLWIFALLTIAAGWFLLQPGMGLGWAAANTPSPWKVRIMGLLAHTAFALGMWAVVVFA